jgi:hypothetical protein
MTVASTAADELDDPGQLHFAPLRDTLTGTLAVPGEPDYQRIVPWNLAISTQPCAASFVASAQDVVATVRFAAAHSLTVSVQATGHGALPVGADTILVHTSHMAGCSIDPITRTARVGAGSRWRDVIDAAAPYGLAPLAGSAPDVGVVGFLTGGGIGPFVRTFGLSADYVRAFELVTGAGEILRATAERHADLFWGLRGGKGTLGIVTAVEIELLPIAEFYGGALYFDGSHADSMLHAWRRWCTHLPETANTSIALLQLPTLPGVPAALADRFTVAVRYAAVGDLAEAERHLRPMRAMAAPLIDTVQVRPYSTMATVHADPVDPVPTHEGHTLLRELTPETVDALLTVAGPRAGSVQAMVEVRMLGGALARPSKHRSAFCHRDAAFAAQTVGVLTPSTAAVPAHSKAVLAALAPWSTGGELPNFAPSNDPVRQARCYTEDTRCWLAALAERYDPAGVLRTGQVARLGNGEAA